MVAQLEDVMVEFPQEGVAVASFAGEHDLTTRPSISELLEGLVDGNELVVADFSQAQFVDSSILHTLLLTDRFARERGKTFRLQLGTAAIVERALEVSGVLEQISCASSREAALTGSEPADA
jgi:anti-anti-sigma factor